MVFQEGRDFSWTGSGLMVFDFQDIEPIHRKLDFKMFSQVSNIFKGRTGDRDGS